MDAVVVILLLLAAIGVLAVAVAIVNQRRNPGSRGSEPGEGYHTLTSDYQSGVGGGQSRTWTVPRDPQAYARLFVPKDAEK